MTTGLTTDGLTSATDACLKVGQQNVFKNSASCSTSRQTTAVVNRLRPSKPVINNRRPLSRQHLWYDAKVEEEVGQLFLAVGDIPV